MIQTSDSTPSCILALWQPQIYMFHDLLPYFIDCIRRAAFLGIAWGEKPKLQKRDNINYLQEKLMSMTVNAYYIGMSFKVATLDTFNG